MGYLPQQVIAESGQTIYDFILQGFNKEEEIPLHYQIDQMLHPLQLDGSWELASLSGGQQRRGCLGAGVISKA